MEAVASRLEAIASRLEAIALRNLNRPLDEFLKEVIRVLGWSAHVGWRPSLVGWRPLLLVTRSY